MEYTQMISTSAYAGLIACLALPSGESRRNNVEQATCPMVPYAPQFAVMAIEEIKTAKGRTIFPGEFILIDPRPTPEEGKMVLVGLSLERWAGQTNVRGVAAAIWSDELEAR